MILVSTNYSLPAESGYECKQLSSFGATTYPEK